MTTSICAAICSACYRHEIEAAESGEAALAAVSARPPDPIRPWLDTYIDPADQQAVRHAID